MADRHLAWHITFVLTAVFSLPATTAWSEGGSHAPVFSSYLGGSASDSVRDVIADDEGNVYLTGGTVSPDFPTTPGAYDQTYNGDVDAFAMKLDSTGQLIWSTFIGSSDEDYAYAVKVDEEGNVYLSGRAAAGFPVTNGAFQSEFRGGSGNGHPPQDGFVAKLSADGSTLMWASYFGAIDPPDSNVRDLVVDSAGNIFLASSTHTGSYSQAILDAFENGCQASRFGDHDVVIAKVSNDGTKVLWATYLGGSAWEGGQTSIRLDGAGNPYVLFTTKSSGIATPGAYDTTYAGGEDVFVAKLTPEAGCVVWGTYLGGPENESTEAHEFAVDAQGHAYVAAPTKSPTFPTTPGAFQTTYGGGANDMFVCKLSPDGSTLLASTFIGGNSNDRQEGVAVDAQGRVYFTGGTRSSNFPVTPDAIQPTLRGTRDAVAVVLSADFTQLLYSTFLGGSLGDEGRGAAVDSTGRFYLAGETVSDDFPTVNPFQPVHGGGVDDAWFAAFAFGPDPVVPTVSEWGLVVLILLLMAAGMIALLWRRFVLAESRLRATREA